MSSTARKVAEAVSSTAQKVARAAKGVAQRVAAVTAREAGGEGKTAAGQVEATKATKAASAGAKATPAKKAKAKAKAAKVETKKATKAKATKVAAKKAAKKATKAAPVKAAKTKAASAKATKVVPAKVGPAKAAKTEARQATKVGPAKAAKTEAKQATKGAGLALTGPLGDWLARLNTSIASLQADPRVDVVVNWQAPGATGAQLDAVEAKLGLSLGPAIRNLYQQADGFALVWGPKGECPRSLKGRPKMMYMEMLGGARGAIYMPPIAEVFGVRGRPFFDYAQFMGGAPSHWGFDFPGNYYTPAFVRVGDGLQVRVGDDHGAAWDGPTVSFERYLENVLASWGSIDERAKQFVKGKGKPVAALPLAKLLG